MTKKFKCCLCRKNINRYVDYGKLNNVHHLDPHTYYCSDECISVVIYNYMLYYVKNKASFSLFDYWEIYPKWVSLLKQYLKLSSLEKLVHEREKTQFYKFYKIEKKVKSQWAKTGS